MMSKLGACCVEIRCRTTTFLSTLIRNTKSSPASQGSSRWPVGRTGRDRRVKFTQYFLYTRQRPDRAGIKLEWIEAVDRQAVRIQVQQDGRVRKWGYVEEVGKYLRIIVLEDGETIHNAFFDRDFEEPRP